MSSAVSIGLVFAVLFTATLAALELGRRFGERRSERDPEGTADGLGPLEGAVYGLMGLLIGFTFAAASSRFETRLDLFIREMSSIETAYLRTALVPVTAEPRLRAEFRSYLDARTASFEAPRASPR